MMDRYQGIHRPRMITEITYARELAMFDSIAACADLSSAPLFFTCCFEFAGFDWMPEMYEIQERFAAELAGRFAKRKIAPVTNSAVAEFYRRHYTETPESVLYLPDVWAGRVDTGYDRPRPAAHPDTMEIENGSFKAIFRKGEILPYAYYDYTKNWDYPHADNSKAPRNAGGYVIPNTDDRFRIIPPILDTRGFESSLEVHNTPEATEVAIEIVASRDQPRLALALWDLAREYSADQKAYQLTNAQRVIPVRAPYTDNLNVILVADIRAGRNRITLCVGSVAREPRTLDLRLGKNTLAKVLDLDGSPVAYLYAAGDEPETVRLFLQDNQVAKLYPYVARSDEPAILNGESQIEIVPKEYRLLTGLSFGDLQKACVTATGSRRTRPPGR